MNPSLRIRQIKETCIYSRDLESMKAFYEGLLGLEIINYLPGKHIFFRAGTSVLLCFNPDDSRLKKSPPGHYAEGKYHFAFEVAHGDYETHKIAIAQKEISGFDCIERLRATNPKQVTQSLVPQWLGIE